MDFATLGNSIVSSIVSGLTGGAFALTAASFFFARWVRHNDARDAKIEADRDAKIADLAEHTHPDLLRRMEAVEAGVDPQHAGAIDQQLRTLCGQVTHMEGRVETIIERQAGIASTVGGLQTHVASVSMKATAIHQEAKAALKDAEDRLTRRIERVENAA